MQRPVMNPVFYDQAPAAKPSRRFRLLRMLAATAWRGVKLVLMLFTYDPFSRLPGFRNEEGSPISRAIRGLMYRLAFVPVLIAAAACAIVWTATHPRTVTTVEMDPASQNIYYDPVTFVGADKTRLEGWLVPTLDVKTMLEQPDRALRAKQPAVVLVHDMGRRCDQVLPLIKPLHDAGFVVLAVNLRGGGAHTATGQTFGLTESGDVDAAIDVLRRRVFVDPNRIAVVGFGTGATAALLAAQDDPGIAAVVAETPIVSAVDLVEKRMLPKQKYLHWLGPLCKWTFEIAYSVDAEEVDLVNFKKLFESRPVLLVDGSSHPDPADSKTVNQVTAYLEAVFPAKTASVAGARR